MITAAQQHAQRNRGTLFVEDAELVSTTSYPGGQFVLRLRAPACAASAQAGSFVHLTCDEAVPMRRPLSIMRAGEDWIEVLFKVVGPGLRRLSVRRPGDRVSVLGPIGRPFAPSPDRPHVLLIGGGVGIPPMVFLADSLRKSADGWRPFAILGSEIPFPFEVKQSALATPWLDPGIDATMPLLEDWGVPARLTSLAGFPGCYPGYVTDLARRWIDSQERGVLESTQLFACGPNPMLRAVSALAADYGLPCQVSLEEFMACAVGGCAGCAVRVNTPDGPAMKRVCVDGPVFDASTVLWN